MIQSGTIVAVTPSVIRVATRQGQITQSRTLDATLYAVGDRVRIVNGVIVGHQIVGSKIIRI